MTPDRKSKKLKKLNFDEHLHQADIVPNQADLNDITHRSSIVS
jgi:hypothetical protein